MAREFTPLAISSERISRNTSAAARAFGVPTVRWINPAASIAGREALPTMAIGKPGATNAAVFAAQILGVADPAMAQKLVDYKKKLAEKVEAAAAKLNG